MNCREIFEALSDYLDDDLDAEACDGIEQHLVRCPPCQAFLNTLQRTVDFCRDTAVEALTPAQKEEIRASIRSAYKALAAGQGFEPR